MPRVHNYYHKTAPPDAVYVGRGSGYGNRFVIDRDGDRDFCCDSFEREQLPYMDVSALRGLDLICYCYPKRCHADSILRKANGPITEDR